MKLKINSILALLLLSPGLGMSFCYAQAGAKGGGRMMEADIRSYMLKLDQFLDSDEGMETFPEIVEYDKLHPEFPFHEILLATRPVVQEGEVLDQFGIARDCVSFADEKGRRFVCQLNKLPEATLQNQPRMYRLVMHELLVQAGIEKPLSKDIPSDYAISARMESNVHLVTHQEWLPGKRDCEGKTGHAEIKIAHPGLFGFDSAYVSLDAKGAVHISTDFTYFGTVGYEPHGYKGDMASIAYIPFNKTIWDIIQYSDVALGRIGQYVSQLTSKKGSDQEDEMQEQQQQLQIGSFGCQWESKEEGRTRHQSRDACLTVVQHGVKTAKVILAELKKHPDAEKKELVACALSRFQAAKVKLKGELANE